MDRVPYRRITPSRFERNSTSAQEEHISRNDPAENEAVISHGETLIMQCILCGIILVFVLVASMTNIAPAVALRGGIRQVLSGAETLDELVTDVRRLGSEWFGWDEPETAPSHELYEEQPLQEYNNHDYQLYPTYDINDYTEPLFNDLYNHDETRLADDSSNPTVPEPTVTPGLWD